MSQNIKINKALVETKGSDLPADELAKIPILPRSAWNSQLRYLKVLLQAKQSLDSRYFNGDTHSQTRGKNSDGD